MSEEIFEDTPETLFGSVEEATVPAPAPAAEQEPKKRGRKPILGDRPMTGAERMSRSRAGERSKADKSARKWNSTTEISKKEAREILQDERLIRHPQVLDVCVDLAKVASRNLGLPFNMHLFTHGVTATLLARELKKEVELPVTEDIWKKGERIRQHELFALFDFGMSWRTQVNGAKFTFEDFKSLRRTAMTDVFSFGKNILGLDLHDEPHGRWARELFVAKNPDLLPEDYDREAFKKALSAQSSIHARMLLSARSSYKSTYNVCDLLSWTLVFPDIRIMMCSASLPLSKGFLRSFRAYWTVKNTNSPTLFNQLFPEFMIYPDETAATSFISPMRKLDLIQPTMNSVSLGSEGLAGERCDLLVTEDAAENNNSGTPEMRTKTLERFDLLLELLEPAPIGYLQMVGTPYSSGEGGDDPGDIYQAVLAREKKHDEVKLLHTICPAWTVKDGVPKLPWDPTLQPEEVELLFPSRLTFPVLMQKLKSSERTFRQQSLCSWVPDADVIDKLEFDQVLLNAACRSLAKIPDGDVVLSCDTSWSLTARSDLSAVAAIRFFTNFAGERCAAVLEVRAERLRTQELAELLAEMSHRHNPVCVLVEMGPSFETIRTASAMAAMKYGIQIPLRSVQPSNSKGAKFARIKNLSVLLSQGRLLFAQGDWITGLFAEAEKLDGAATTKNKRDDRWDAIAQGCETYKITAQMPVKASEEESESVLARERRATRDLAQYNAMFPGTNPIDMPAQKQEESPPQPRRNVAGGVSGRFATLPQNFRQQGRR